MAVDFALQFKRQYAGSLDVDYQKSTSERNNLLNDPTRYAGQIVFDTDENKPYYLSADLTEWLPFGTGKAESVEWSGITGVPTAFTPTEHTHTITDITDLQNQLNSKSDTAHTHSDLATNKSVAFSVVEGRPNVIPDYHFINGNEENELRLTTAGVYTDILTLTPDAAINSKPLYININKNRIKLSKIGLHQTFSDLLENGVLDFRRSLFYQETQKVNPNFCYVLDEPNSPALALASHREYFYIGAEISYIRLPEIHNPIYDGKVVYSFYYDYMENGSDYGLSVQTAEQLYENGVLNPSLSAINSLAHNAKRGVNYPIALTTIGSSIKIKDTNLVTNKGSNTFLSVDSTGKVDSFNLTIPEQHLLYNNLGYYTTGNTSTGEKSFALGISNEATGKASVAFGQGNKTSASYTLAVGSNSTVSALNAVSIGSSNKVEAQGALAVGSSNHISGGIAAYSFIVGNGNLISTRNSFASGARITITGAYATVLGYESTATGTYGIAMGWQAKALHNGAIAIGSSNTAAGNCATAFGFENNASGQLSNTLGYLNTASGYVSFAGGKGVKSSGAIAFNWSESNDANNVGAAANYSAILGGYNNQLQSTAQRSVILGGQNINGTEPDTVYIPNLIVLGTLKDASGNTINATPTGSTTADWNSITNKPSSFNPSAHSHSISDVSDLQNQLNSKANTSHSHSEYALTDHSHSQYIRTVNGQTPDANGNVVIATGSGGEFNGYIEWGNVLNKPSAYTPIAHSHSIADVTNLQTTLNSLQSSINGKANSIHTHTIADVTNLQSELNNKAGVNHSHSFNTITDKPNFVFSVNGATPDATGNVTISTGTGGSTSADWSTITNKPSTFTPSAHSHSIGDISDLQNQLNGKASTNHSHSEYAAVNHSHSNYADVNHSHSQYALDSVVVKKVNGIEPDDSGNVNITVTGNGNLIYAKNTSSIVGSYLTSGGQNMISLTYTNSTANHLAVRLNAVTAAGKNGSFYAAISTPQDGGLTTDFQQARHGTYYNNVTLVYIDEIPAGKSKTYSLFLRAIEGSPQWRPDGSYLSLEVVGNAFAGYTPPAEPSDPTDPTQPDLDGDPTTRG